MAELGSKTIEMWAEALEQLSPLRRMSLWYAVVEGENLPDFADRMARGEMAAIDLVQSSLTCLGSVLVSMQAEGSVDRLDARLATVSSVDLSAGEHRQLRARLAAAVQGDEVSAAALLRRRPKKTWFTALEAVPAVEPRSRQRGLVLAVAASAVVAAGVGGLAILGTSDGGTAVASARDAVPAVTAPIVSPADPVPSTSPSPSADPQAVEPATTFVTVPVAAAGSPSITVAPAPSGSPSSVPTKNPVPPAPSTPSDPSASPIAVSIDPDNGQISIALDLGFGSPIKITTPPILTH